jgi:hypothetical protein
MLGFIRSWLARREYRRIGEQFTTADALRREVRNYDEARCAELVEDLVSGDSKLAWLALQGLNEADRSAVLGPLMKALGDDRFLDPPKGSAAEERHALAWFNKPLPRVLRVLQQHQPLPPEAAPALRRLAEVAPPQIAADARKLLAGMGEPVDVKKYRRRLAGKDLRDVSYALRELAKAASRGHANDALLELFDDLAAIIDSDRSDPTYQNHEQAALLMLKLDRRRAADVLLDPKRFNAQHPALFDVLEALVESGERVSPQRLLPLLEGLWPVQRNHPPFWARVKGSALRLAARVDDPACRAYIDKAFYSGDADLAARAASAWAEANGLPRRVADGKLYNYRDESLPTVVRRWSAAHFFKSWTSNDGIADPVRRADLAGPALAGMRAAGADQCVAIAERAIELLVGHGAAFDDPRVEALEKEFWALGDELDVKLMRWAAEHKQEFLLADRREDEKEAAEKR